MKYNKPFGQFIQFDNSDIIVTSRGDLNTNCSKEVNQYTYCTELGDSHVANACGTDGLVCSFSKTYECWLLFRNTQCDTSGNEYYYNSIIEPPSGI